MGEISLSVRALLQVLVGGLLISFSGVFVKLAQVGPSTSAFYRVFFGGFTLLVLALIRRESFVASRQIWTIVFLASLFFALDLEVWHRSIIYIGPGLATILSNFQVFILAFIGILFFGEKLSKRLVAALPTAFCGLWFLVGVDMDNLPEKTVLGIVLGLTTALCYASYILALRRSQNRPDKLPPMANMAVISLGTSLFSFLFTLFHGESFAIPTLVDGGYLLAYGILCQGIGWVLLSTSLPLLPPSIGGLLLLIQPTFSFIWDILFFQRPTGPFGLLGACLAIFAIWAGVSGQQKANR